MIVAVFGADIMELAGDEFSRSLSAVLSKYDLFESPVLLLEHSWMTYSMLDFILTSPFRASTFEDRWPTYSPHHRAMAALNCCSDTVFMLPPELLFSKKAHQSDMVGYAVLSASLGRKIYSSDYKTISELIKVRLKEADDELLH